MFMEVLLVELVHTWDLNTLRCLYRQHGTSCAWAKGLKRGKVTTPILKIRVYILRRLIPCKYIEYMQNILLGGDKAISLTF